MQRLFSMKSSYMILLIRKILGVKDNEVVSILKITKIIIKELLESKFKIFYGEGVDEISEDLGINIYNRKSKLSKNYVQLLVSKILRLTINDLSKRDKFVKSSIKFKTIRVEKNVNIKFHRLN